ncbi:energy transducer TonB [Hymenobacter glacialis]|uniref:TonB C-terminal domain-containing protein n=1 Tax=Hymenobacter glacialis TaxID=1908236 RepID=A0A1G1T7S2_9BACT|nr:hypothetical protein [Hymenobacter glacialis]OGX86931.1 hypothetical protein BEN48_00800 [Hymenobacter glacialis]
MRHHVIFCVFLGLLGMAGGASAQRTARPLPGGKKDMVGTLPLLPRFWHLADSAERADAAEVFNQYLHHFIKYPMEALNAGVGGIIYALITVLPNGSASSITIIRRDLSTGAPPGKAVQALDAELQRVAWQLRFKPALARIDSSASANASAKVTELDVTTDAKEDTETDGSIDITEQPKPSPILADTVTIYYRFATQ